MTAQTIDKRHAIAATEPAPLRALPVKLDTRALVDVLARVGLTIPTSVSAAAAKGEPLRAAKHRFTVREVDAALTKASVGLSDRFRVKAAMEANGIL